MVGHAFLLTASLFTGQTTDYQVVSTPQQNCNCNKNGSNQAQPQSQPRQPLFGNGNRPILSKIGALFGNKQNQEPQQQQVAESVPDYYRRMPTTTGSIPIINTEPPLMDKTIQPAVAQPDAVKPISMQTGPALVTKSSPLKAEFAGKVGHEQDFTWVTGQLEKENGQWVIYYATADTVDRYNGRLVMQPQGELRGAKIGDLVSVHGSVAQSQGRPIYLATRIDLIERDQK